MAQKRRSSLAGWSRQVVAAAEEASASWQHRVVMASAEEASAGRQLCETAWLTSPPAPRLPGSNTWLIRQWCVEKLLQGGTSHVAARIARLRAG